LFPGIPRAAARPSGITLPEAAEGILKRITVVCQESLANVDNGFRSRQTVREQMAMPWERRRKRASTGEGSAGALGKSLFSSR